MEFADYSREARKTAVYPTLGHPIVYPALGLAGEAGEVVEKVKKAMRDDGMIITGSRRQELIKELGDVLWYLAAITDELGTTLEYVALCNIEKLKSRLDRGVISGQGDNR